jgi:hypothetical protein
MRIATLMTLLLFPCSVWAVLGQQSKDITASAQGGESSQAPQPLTNDSIVKLVTAGLGEDTIIGIVNTQPGRYAVATDDIIALKKPGVPEKVIAAMVNKPTTYATSAPGAAPFVEGTEVGVYFKKGDTWVEVVPEVVNWQTGGVTGPQVTDSNVTNSRSEGEDCNERTGGR